MKNKRFRIISLIALALLIAALIPGIIALSTNENPVAEIRYNSEKASAIILFADEKKTISCESNASGMLSYQWQINANVPGADWVDINGKTDKYCEVSYALVANLLDANFETRLRCVVSDAENEYISDPITVIIDYDGSLKELYPTATSVASSPKKTTKATLINNDIDELYTITINYIYQDQEIAQKPTNLSLAAGSAVENHIQPIPPNVGFDPVLQDSYEGVEIVPLLDEEGNPTGSYGVQLNFPALDGPKIINVVYMPALVEYKVYHYRQNLLDDNYEEEPFRIVYLQGYTGSVVEDCHLDIDGFHALYYKRMEIAADGSTQVDIYYDRDYYLVSFSLAGGFGVDPIYTRYGSEIGVNNPTRPGYVFGGWTLDSVNGHAPTVDEINRYLFTSTSSRIPVEATLSYTANWKRGNTTYTMAFWRENPNDDGYSFWGSMVVDSHPNGTKLLVGDSVDAQDWVSRVGGITDEAYFTYNPSRSDKGVILNGDGSSIVNVYYTRNRYTITFKASGKCILEEKHTHSSACYTDVCGQEHVHNESCVSYLACTIPEHIKHDFSCISCGKEEHIHGVDCSGIYDCGKSEHTHSPDCCTITPHEHTVSCYPNVGTEAKEPGTSGFPNYDTFPTNATNGYIAKFKSRWNSTTYHYIYIDGKWYNYSKTANDGTIVGVTCGKTVHVHGETTGCVHCEVEEHVHSVDCVNCDKTEHTHSLDCYKDEIHVHDESCYRYESCEEHIHTDACMLLTCAMTTGHSHTSACNSSSSTSVVKLVTRKYQASLADIWPVTDDHGVKYTSGERWKPSDSSYYSQVLVYIADMPADDFTLTVDVSSYKTFTMHYMLEALPGETGTSTYNNKKFKESFVVKANYNHITKAEDFFDIKGFTQYGSNPAFSNNQISQNGGDVYFYYKRNTGSEVRIEFNNVNTIVKSYYGDDLMYGLSLADYQYDSSGNLYTPPYPDVYEKNAYQFDQWYTTPTCIPGTEVNWSTLTQPDGVLSLYAHWIPVKHTVKIFKDATLDEQIGEAIEVEHGTLIPDPGHPTNGQYIFSGWFYKDDDGVEKAFVFNGIPVKDSLNIYAKWSSRVAVKYTIYYKVVNPDGTETEVARPTEGSTIAGQNSTFDAKGGIDLYEAYREGYFPDSASHSIIMSAENENTHTFYYVKKEGVPYTVRYLDADGNPLADDKYVEDNQYSVVTETFKPISGYIPKNYQQRLIVSANEEENVLVFTYTKDEIHAVYMVVHYWENLNGEYVVHSSVDITATVGTICAAKPITINGYEYFEARLDGEIYELDSGGSLRAMLDSDGMEIAFYYKRQMVEYTIEYVKSGASSEQLAEPVTKTALFGTTVYEPALDLTSKGYNRVSDAIQSITIKASGNRIVFRYQENTANYKYVAVEGDVYNENYHSETIGAITGNALGKIPVNTTDYTFVGWFIDAECTVRVDPERDHVILGDDNKLVPQKTDSNGDGVYLYEGGVFYAKFNYNFSRLTISVTGCPDENAYFIFVVEPISGGDSITVAVRANSSVTIENMRVGNYRVRQVDDWSWRYEEGNAMSADVRVTTQAGGSVSFDRSVQDDKWLDGEGYSQIVVS